MVSVQSTAALDLPSVTAEKQRLRIGVLLDSLTVPLWAHRVLTRIDESDVAELALIVLMNRKVHCGSAALFRWWRRIDEHLFRQRCMAREAFQPAVFSPHGRPEWLACVPAEAEDTFSFSAADLENITQAEIDVLLHLGRGVPANGIGECTRYGVWRFGDDRDTSASLFWTLYEDGTEVENELNILTSTGKNERMLCSRIAADHVSFFRNHSNACWKRPELVVHCLAELQRHGSPGKQELLEPPAVPAGSAQPRNRDVVRLFPRLASRAIRDEVRKRFLREQWFVAFRKSPAHAQAERWDDHVTILWPPRDRFYADPFVIDRDGKSYMFFEDFSFRQGKAVISFVELEAGNCTQPEVALEEDYHLSFPCVFEWQDEIYMLPETKGNRSIQVYRATDFPRLWQLDTVLMSGVSAVDSTLLHREGRWWLFTSGLGTSDPWFDGDSELRLFFAEELSGPWMAHPRNPIVTDVCRGRSAGRFFHLEDQLIRPAQDCSAVYGYAVSLNRVEVLSETDYHEVPVGAISREWVSDNRGTHTYNRSPRYEVLDGRRLVGRLSHGTVHPSLETIKTTAALIRQI